MMSTRKGAPERGVLRATVSAKGLLLDLDGDWKGSLGVAAAALESTPFLALFEDGEREGVRALVARAAAGERPGAEEFSCRRGDGTFARVRWRLRSIGDGAVSVLGRDVGRARLRRAERAALARFAEVGVVTAAVAHDLSNVLSVIGLASTALRAEAAGPLERRRDLDDLDEALGHARGLVREVLEHCRRPPVRAARVDLNEIVSRMGWLLRHIGRRDVFVDLRLARGLSPAQTDETTVGQALLNLALNARDAMPNGGRLLVETGELRLARPSAGARSIPPGDFVSLSVSDTGAGLPPEARGRLFEPFFTTKPGGSGLGLYALRRSVERCGGAVEFSTGAAGTRFTLHFRKAAA